MGRAVLSRSIWPAVAALLAGLAAGLALVGFASGERSARFWRERQRRVDPPELWSIEAVPQPAGWAPIRICTDSVVRTGFAQPIPTLAGETCRPIDPPTWQAGRYAFRCALGGRVYGVSAVVTGAPRRDFEANFSVTDLGGFLARADHAPATYAQTRRYRRLGACPAGWEIGDATDRTGRLQRSVLVAASPASSRP